MENKLECRPVLLPTETGGVIYKSRGIPPIFEVARFKKHIQNNHLYLVSDREIKEGNWVLITYSKLKNYKGSSTGPIKWDRSCHTEKGEFVKIEASTDPSLGLPGIPTDWIENEYVAKQGKIDKVYIESITYAGTESLSLTTNDEVIILPTVEDEKSDIEEKIKQSLHNFANAGRQKTYTREEVINILLEYEGYLLSHPKDDVYTISHRNWMALNYPVK